MTRRLFRDERGIALVEFALSVPLLLLMFIGSYQLTDAISAYRKVTTATRAIADLSSQYTTVSNSDLDNILAASQQIMAPYKYANANLVIVQVTIDGSGNSTVCWSRGLNATPPTKGTAFTIPSAMKVNGTYLLVAQTTYTYTPVAATSLIGTIPMKDQIILSPRLSAAVTNTDQPC
ncbi:TadE/TadG family type IV pilus assembly protein [Sphingomonas sp. GlSt437]|uniref:TadE/TadG family type IV pilus assembly protein n=1 Tax=Sphingomonas sp. GlSt437 TaxID=3389970 RepID=UPI003A8C1765